MNKKLNIAFRCHIKNDERFAILKRTINSAKEAELQEIGNIYLVDDHSEQYFSEKIIVFCEENSINYKKANGFAHTRNGLVESLSIDLENPMLCCVDDIIFSKRIKQKIEEIYERYIPTLETNNINWGLLGMFACYNRNTKSNYLNLDLWDMNVESVYALVCHFFNPKLSNILKSEWELIKENKKELNAYQDDLWTAIEMKKNNLIYLNTNFDYVQHIGERARSFGEDNGGDNSCYKTNFFLE